MLRVGEASTTSLAVDTSSGQLCIVKSLELPREHVRELCKLLEREARAYAALSHPRIPQLIEAFPLEEQGGTSYVLVTEYVEGRDLARVVREGGLYGEAKALALLRSLAELLGQLHSHTPSLTHRAVRPEKVIVGPAGEPHLVDFGSWSRAMRRLLGPEGAKSPADPRGYTAPEQLDGRPVPASDVYALGATVTFALTGKDPAELGGRPKLAVSRRLRRVLHRMLVGSPQERYADAREVLRALDEPSLVSRLVDRRVAAAGAALLALAAVLFTRGPAPKPPAAKVVSAAPAPRPATSATPDPSRRPRPAQRSPRPRPAGPREDPSRPPQRITADRPVSLDQSLPSVQSRFGVLSIDVYRAFKYVASGWPGGLSVGQTNASGLDTRPHEALRAEPRYQSQNVLYGYLTLGDGPDPRISFALDERERPTWVLWVDKNNNKDLTDDGPPLRNQGTGFMAATVSLWVDFVTRDSGVVRRPYRLWFWVNEAKNAPPGTPPYAARFYATCHYAGRVDLGGEVFDAVAFEQGNHDGLLAEDGIWIDLDRDGKFKPPTEHFHDGEEIRTGREVVRLRLERH